MAERVDEIKEELSELTKNIPIKDIEFIFENIKERLK